MIIDFHTHIFPDKIATNTIALLSSRSGETAHTDGSLNQLLKSMKSNNIDYCVTLPVVTKPSQFNTINTFAKELQNVPGIISFGGIHPDSDNIDQQLEYLKSNNFLGIKLHPDYHSIYMDDPRYIHLIKKAIELDLIIVIHAGVDIEFPNDVHCTPKNTANLLSYLPNNLMEKAKIVLAHTGGYNMWDDVEKYLVGKNLYFDISYSLSKIDDSQFIRILNNHGANRIIFATDSPWQDQGYCISYLNNLDISAENKELILYKNAATLLNLNIK